MDIVQTIAAALALGAAAGLKETTTQAVKDGYAALRNALNRDLPTVVPGVEQLEQLPDSRARRAVVEEDLAKCGPEKLEELGFLVSELLARMDESASQEADQIGVDLKGLRAAALRISDIRSGGSGVRVENADVSGDVEISGVESGTSGGRSPNV